VLFFHKVSSVVVAQLLASVSFEPRPVAFCDLAWL
jgi:hypothetical protein